MSEEQQRQEAVRRRLAGESPAEIADALLRTSRWVRKRVARHHDQPDSGSWAQSRSRALLTSPGRTPADVEHLILKARERLVANPQAQYGSLAIQWVLRSVGVVDIPPARTIERVLARENLAGLPTQRRPPRDLRPPHPRLRRIRAPVGTVDRPGPTLPATLIRETRPHPPAPPR